VFVNPFLVNAYRRKKPEGAHVIVSHRLAENGLAVTMIHTGTSFPGRHISAILRSGSASEIHYCSKTFPSSISNCVYG
jgi:hypothetical protein